MQRAKEGEDRKTKQDVEPTLGQTQALNLTILFQLDKDSKLLLLYLLCRSSHETVLIADPSNSTGSTSRGRFSDGLLFYNVKNGCHY